MSNIPFPPTRANIVRETMIRSQKGSVECNARYTVVIYDLAIAKIAKQIQSQEHPTYENVFVMFAAFHIEASLFAAVGKIIEGSGRLFILAELGKDSNFVVLSYNELGYGVFKLKLLVDKTVLLCNMSSM